VPRERQPSLHLQFLLLVFAGWINRHQQAVIEYLQAENQSLREQLGNKRIRWTDAQRRRLAEKAKAIGRSMLAALGTVVTPDTLLRWYRNLVAAKYDGSRQRGPGRPRTKPDIVRLVIRMARENPSWGYTRIRGALFNLGHEVARNTIKSILKENGLEPAPERGRHSSWHTFIKSHLGAIAGADFFTVEHSVSYPRSGSSLHGSISSDAQRCRRESGSIAVAKPKFELLCREMDTESTVRVLVARDSAWRSALAKNSVGVSGALSSGTQPSRARQSPHRTCCGQYQYQFR